uniref:Uncharacterized protein n=1 Tax=Anopheles dirus TaxID=7168 RepID=A0A182NHL8_9DIPT
MPSQPYDLVKDDQDIRVPLYPEQAFYGTGLAFQAKLCGSKFLPLLWVRVSGSIFLARTHAIVATFGPGI